MKKCVLIFLMVSLLLPPCAYANKYNRTKLVKTHVPTRMPSLYQIEVYLDGETGDMAIIPNYDVTDLRITLTGGSITYIDETITLFAGMSFNDCLDYLYDGEYILTLSTANGIIDQYLITVKSD